MFMNLFMVLMRAKTKFIKVIKIMMFIKSMMVMESMEISMGTILMKGIMVITRSQDQSV